MATSLGRQSPFTWVQILRKCGRILASIRNSFRTSTETQRPSIPDQKQLEKGAEFCTAVNCQKRWRQMATSPANKRIATAISVNPALILSIGREWGQSKFTFSEASAKTS